VSTLDHKLEPEVTTVHRLEVISGTGRRRQFTEDFKARVVEETLAPGAIVSDVARQHGLSVSHRRIPRARRRSSCQPLWRRRCHQGHYEDGSASGAARPEAAEASR